MLINIKNNKSNHKNLVKKEIQENRYFQHQKTNKLSVQFQKHTSEDCRNIDIHIQKNIIYGQPKFFPYYFLFFFILLLEGSSQRMVKN